MWSASTPHVRSKRTTTSCAIFADPVPPGMNNGSCGSYQNLGEGSARRARDRRRAWRERRHGAPRRTREVKSRRMRGIRPTPLPVQHFKALNGTQNRGAPHLRTAATPWSSATPDVRYRQNRKTSARHEPFRL